MKNLTKRIITLSVLCIILIINNKVYALNTHITANTTWTSGTIYDDYIIDPGVTLTISGTIDMGNYQITVDANHTTSTTPGGRLIITSGSKLTTSSTYWQGIRVLNNGGYNCIGANYSQQDPRVGMATIDNATIEKAWYGVCNDNTSSIILITGYGCITQGGGIIRVSNTTFNNNFKDVVMENFQNFSKRNSSILLNDASHFSLCTFQNLNSTLNGSWTNPTHVLLKNQCLVVFSGCSFVEPSWISGSAPKFYGIYGPQSAVFVGDYYNLISCLSCSPIHSSFSNLLSGVYAKNSTTNYTVQVYNAAFTNCYDGIDISAYSNADIEGNTFNVHPSIISSGWYPPTDAIYLNTCTGYTVAGNTINGASPVTSDNVYGIYSKISGQSNNFINNNTLNKTYAALEADGNNLNTSNNKIGLFFLCNSMSNTVSTFYDIAVTGSSSDGIATIQASYSSGSGARQSAMDIFSSGFSSGSYGNYSNSCTSLEYDYASSSTTPTYYSSSSVSLASKSSNSCNYCPSPNTNLGLGCSITSSYISYAANLAEIEIGLSTATGENYASLMVQYNKLVNSMLKQYHYVSDTVNDTISTDSSMLVLASTHYDFNYQIQLALVYAHLRQYSSATSILGNIPSHYPIDATTASVINNIISLVGVASDLYAVSNNWGSMPSSDISLVDNLAAHNAGLDGSIARSYTSIYEDIYYPPTFNDPATFHGSKTDPLNYNRALLQKSGAINLYPNPATNVITVAGLGNDDFDMIITNISGKEILKRHLTNDFATIDISALTQGIYFVRVFNPNSGFSNNFKFARQ